ncbi:MAG: PspC domain-containing protein [Bacteroidales bacterium]|nr:PspC domain-containing protein [Bacteroidales bacterium]
MKKNFSVNIGGRVFNIDDDAYERLNNYLANLRRHFSADQGCEEILGDIEGRIAELLEQKVSAGNSIITLSLINEVINSMGEPDQLSGQEAESRYRSFDGKSSGKLFRDPDNRLIGGVAAGIGAYFKIDPTWVRILFVLFTFLYAVGAIIYVILWLIIPPARTTSERLEMQRRLINIDTLREEVLSAGSGIKKTSNSLLRSLGKFLRFLTEIVTHVFRLILQLLRLASGAFLLLLVLGMFVGLSLIYIIREPMNTGQYFFENTTVANLFSWLMPGPSILWLAYIAIGLVALGLAGMLIYLGLRLLLKWPPVQWQVFGVFGLLIVAGLICGGGAIYQYSRSTLETASDSKVEAFPYNQKLIHLSMAPDNPEQYWKPLEGNDIEIYKQQVLGKIKVSLRPTNDSLFLSSIKEATAFRQHIAANYLENIRYSYTIKDTLLTLLPFFTFPKSEGMHHQTMEIILGIPENTVVNMDDNFFWFCNNRDFVDWSNSGGKYIMTSMGLKPVRPVEPDSTQAN